MDEGYYVVCSANNTRYLEKQVNKMLVAGYVISGSMTSVYDVTDDVVWFCQPMIADCYK